MPKLSDTRGVALPLAIFALVVVGAMVAGAFFIGRQEHAVGRNSLKLQQAFAAAEAGAHTTVADWDIDVYNTLTAGASLNFQQTIASGWYRGTLRRLNKELFLVRSEGFSPDSTARQHVGLLIRLKPIEINITAALETRGNLDIGGSAEIDGTDNPPVGWTCPPAEPPVSGIRIQDSSTITTSGCPSFNCVQGTPLIEEDPAITDSALMTFGDAEFDELRQLATKIVPPGNYQIQPSITGVTCNRSVASNWGSPLIPLGPCGDYFPLIWVDGNLTVNGVQGQGVLLVNGNLSVDGNFQFFGPVIVRGALSTQGSGGHFNGGVIAANVNLNPLSVLGDAEVTFSSCAINRALMASAQGAPLRERSWVNLY